MRLFLTLCNLLLLFTACEKPTLAPNMEVLGLEFFPMDLQNVERYAVEEINYNNDGTVDTVRYLLQDDWVDSVNTDEGVVLKGYRYRSNENGNRFIESTVVKKRNAQFAKFRVGNSEELKLSFPITEAKSWNGKPQEFEVDEFSTFRVFQPYEINDSVFETTVQLIQEDNQDSISNFEQRIEVYALQTGLIYKISSQLEFCRETECLGLQQIEFGKTTRLIRKFD